MSGLTATDFIRSRWQNAAGNWQIGSGSLAHVATGTQYVYLGFPLAGNAMIPFAKFRIR